MTDLKTIYAELSQSRSVLSDFMDEEANLKAIQNAADIMINCLKNGGKIIACGNGGSMCDAMHFASELTGKYRKDRPPIAAVAIADPTHLSCVGNDYGYDYIFARYIDGHGRPGDVFLGLSTSGKSVNVLLAMEAAKKIGMSIVGIGGESSPGIRSALTILADSGIKIPHSGTADRTQELTIIILHILVHLIEKGLGYE